MNHTIIPLAMNSSSNYGGYLELIIGPMYSGKTSKLLELYKQFTFCGIKTLVINYSEDTRYSSTELSSHDKIMIPCKQAYDLFDDICNFNNNLEEKRKYKDFYDSQVILINEGQFFSDIQDWTKCAVEKHGKSVYICGLDGDFQRQPFGKWLDLIPLCDKVTKLQSYCSQCKMKPALFSHRLSKEKTQKVIGSDSYIPLCRLCYLQLNNANPTDQ
jgi:thymidine kinase